MTELANFSGELANLNFSGSVYSLIDNLENKNSNWVVTPKPVMGIDVHKSTISPSTQNSKGFFINDTNNKVENGSVVYGRPVRVWNADKTLCTYGIYHNRTFYNGYFRARKSLQPMIPAFIANSSASLNSINTLFTKQS